MEERVKALQGSPPLDTDVSSYSRISAAIDSRRRVPSGHRGRGGYHATAPYFNPYKRPQGATFRNRSLIISNPQPSTSAEQDSKPASSDATVKDSWVSKHDRHLQLINKSVYDKQVEERISSKGRLLTAHYSGMFDEMAESETPPHSSSPYRTRKSPRSYDTFKVVSRIGNLTAWKYTAPPAPSVSLAVSFGRSLTSDSVKKELCRNFCRTGNASLIQLLDTSRHGKKYPTNIILGFCRKGPSCRFLHDASKVAICKEFLSKGTCRNGLACNLSHQPNAHRCPACIHFVRGNCNNNECRYAHVKVSSSAPICPAFANLGYCEEGADCPNRHEFECPEYSSKGSCSNPRCRLPHIDRAGQLRQTSGSTNSAAEINRQSGSGGDNDLALLQAALGEKSTKDLDSTATVHSSSRSSTTDDGMSSGGEVFERQSNFVSLGEDDTPKA
jgi:hypothetical protein